MAIVHFVLQGKGGAGKSFLAYMMLQAFQYYGKEVKGVDLDPISPTLYGFTELGILRIDVMDGDNIDSRNFDKLIELIFNSNDDCNIVVDTGASSFVAFGSYLKECDIMPLLIDNGHTVYIHTVISGEAAIETTQGFASLATSFPTLPLCVWLNSYFGAITLDGKDFESFQVYKDHSSQIHALLTIPSGGKTTLGQDLKNLVNSRQTFKAALEGEGSIVVKSRLKRFLGQFLSEFQKADLAA